MSRTASAAPLVDVWVPIVYGRTVKADNWWRAVPRGLPYRGWLGSLVSVVVAGGERLERPRFLLARWAGHWVVGVACMASELSSDFASDGSRPLYTFVGWAAPVDDTPPPALGELEGHYREWAGPIYRDWVGRDWELHHSRVREPHPTEAVPTHWPTTAASDDDGPALNVVEGEIQIWPAEDQARLWAAGAATTSSFVLAVGWDAGALVPRAELTHAAADDVKAPTAIPRKRGNLVLPRAPDPKPPQAPDPTEDAVSPHRARIRIGPPRASSWGSLGRRVEGIVRGIAPFTASGAKPGVHVQLLILGADDDVLVARSDVGRRLPAVALSEPTSPRDACLQVAELLHIGLTDVVPVAVDYVARGGERDLVLTFYGEVAGDETTIHAPQDLHLELRALTDPDLPQPIVRLARRVGQGDTELRYSEISSIKWVK